MKCLASNKRKTVKTPNSDNFAVIENRAAMFDSYERRSNDCFHQTKYPITYIIGRKTSPHACYRVSQNRKNVRSIQSNTMNFNFIYNPLIFISWKLKK
jgi:hypothetical protein